MTNDILASPAHPTDAEILRYRDGEIAPAERTAIGAHLTECAACANTLRAFTATTALVRQQPAATPAASDLTRRRALHAARAARRARRTRLLLRAAVAVLAVGSVGAVTPVRAWIVELFRRPAPAPVAPAPTPAPADVPQPGSTVSFVPSSPRFVVELEAAQPAGTLTLRPGDGPTASARVADARAGVGLLILENGIRIRNTTTDSTSYLVTVPPTVAEVTVRWASGATSSFSRADLDAETVLALDLGG